MTNLDRIRAELIADPDNAWAREAGYAPLYTADVAAKVALIGQAPGRKAQESGIPWHDASGVKLRRWLGVTDEEFYDPELFAIVPMDFFYPGKAKSGDLPPRRGVAQKWHPRIFAELPDIRLKVIVGSYAQKYYLPGRPVTETVRAYQDYLPSAIPLVHPSPLNVGWHLRNPWFEQEVVPELQALVAAALKS
ncbi:uracil-DNA glycosylase family protein [Amycolatopsis rhabdoformis]|uniref:Uracil-DNA glycosylase family protein n=1 Tax=Amycolatopsis rhabdoformis TaxID=1448059 RepID=A0ABZ1IKF2_9PSEU|nr:uracil-DNA glycosylase family protein [Amycolatopsis rhabdoformis]WSE34251.1 uracil-DNA glycosylase family protein [Amycolatopsis rhabdoformis]